MTDVFISGPLCNNDVAITELLKSRNVDCCVIRYEKDRILDFSSFAGQLKYFNPSEVKYVNSSIDFLKTIKGARLLISISGAAINNISPWWDWVYKLPGMPKVINMTTGSDITELARSECVQGGRYRRFLKNIDFNYISPYPEAIKTLHKLSITNYLIMRPPYYLLNDLKDKAHNNTEKLTFLHASNMDWGESDNSVGRNSTKGNNRFLIGFAKAIKSGVNARCIILDRGPDKNIAKELIKFWGVEDYFEIIPPVSQGDFADLIQSADVVVDQFDVGFSGGIAFEAMAQAKAVMVYIDKNCWPLVYDEAPPVISCHTETEIYEAIVEWSNRKKLQVLGAQAEKWVRKHHDIYGFCFDEFILRVSHLSGLKRTI